MPSRATSKLLPLGGVITLLAIAFGLIQSTTEAEDDRPIEKASMGMQAPTRIRIAEITENPEIESSGP